VAYLYAILGLSVLIIVHEFGHMLVARLFGMRVHTFSVGFGPALVKWRGRHTTYQIALIPLGGFVQIAGMNPHEKLPEGDSGSYANKGWLARIATVVAGPLTNYLAAMVLMVLVISIWGLPGWKMDGVVGEVKEGMPAAEAGLQPGDRIVSIDGQAVESYQQLVKLVRQSSGEPLSVQIASDGDKRTVTVTPVEKEGTYFIGVQPALEFTEVGPGAAIALGVLYPLEQSRRALAALGDLLRSLFAGEDPRGKVGGPVEIVYQLRVNFEQNPIMALVFLAILSAYLGLFNLLPIPALDGGRLLFLIVGAVRRRPLDQRLENLIHTIGFILLLALILMISYCDFARRLGGP
jgi:regulator of sigma E protease